MGQTEIGAAKVAAGKIGCTWQEYLENVQSDFKWCSACKKWVSIDFFNRDLGARDGKCNKCRDCSRAKDRRRYKPIPIDERKPRGFHPQPSRDGDKQQARNKVNRAVAAGKIPHSRNVFCTDCGHLGADLQHEYDHYKGYDAINHLEVECVCYPCHVKRERQRRAVQK